MRPRRRKGMRADDTAVYKQFWRIIDGAVVDAINNHPRYLRDPALLRYLRVSVTKRAVGSLMSYAAVATRPAPGAATTADEGGPGGAQPTTESR